MLNVQWLLDGNTFHILLEDINIFQSRIFLNMKNISAQRLQHILVMY